MYRVQGIVSGFEDNVGHSVSKVVDNRTDRCRLE